MIVLLDFFDYDFFRKNIYFGILVISQLDLTK